MAGKIRIQLLVIVAVPLLASLPLSAQSFTFQGELQQNGSPVSGVFDFEFTLFDGPTIFAGNAISDPFPINNVSVLNGRFTVQLTFPVELFDGSDRWIRVRVDGVVLSPFQKVNPTPYALQARGIFADINNEIGLGTTNPSALFHINREGGDVVVGAASGGMSTLSMPVLAITGGSDFSEMFDVGGNTRIEPGMVVVIDPDNPGRLQPSTTPIDRKAAGIISGAGGVATGMTMGQQGTIADGSHPVALSGRVYCLVDASESAVEPGDMLTTSSTRGHAMKVDDPDSAAGAIIGRAMTRLAAGETGLVLVNLQ